MKLIFGTKLTCSCIISSLFIIVPMLESHSLCLFSYQTFNFFWKCTFHAHYDVYRTRTFLQNYSNFSQISIVKNVNTSFVNITFWCLFFFRCGLTRHVVQPKTNRCPNASDKETCTSSKTYRGENVLEVIAISYKTKLQVEITCIQMCFLYILLSRLSSIIVIVILKCTTLNSKIFTK